MGFFCAFDIIYQCDILKADKGWKHLINTNKTMSHKANDIYYEHLLEKIEEQEIKFEDAVEKYPSVFQLEEDDLITNE